MKLLHAQSQQCLRTELDLFSVLPTQTSIDSSQWVEHNPVSTISASAPIEFVVSGSGEDYLDLSNTLLEVRAKITADGSPTTVPRARRTGEQRVALHVQSAGRVPQRRERVFGFDDLSLQGVRGNPLELWI